MYENKGQALFDHYLVQSDQKDMTGRNNARSAINEKCTNQRPSEDDYVTVDEIKAALRRAKSSAPGPDGIRYEDLSRMSEEDIKELAGIYNSSIESAIIKEEWLHSYLKPLPKPDKDPKKFWVIM